MSDRFIGLDVGGTKIASATLCDGELSESTLVETAIDDRDRLIERVRTAIAALLGPEPKA